jgi:hypothetical protein
MKIQQQSTQFNFLAILPSLSDQPKPIPTFNNPSSSLQHGIWMENKKKQKIKILLGATGIEILF